MRKPFGLILIVVVLGLLCVGCKQATEDQPMPPPATITQPTTPPTTPPPSNPPNNGPSPSLPYTIYDNELKSGGGAFEYPGGNNQILSFVSNTSVSGTAISYNWNGQDPGNGFTTFAGFDLMHTPELNTYNTTPGVDLRAGSYTKVVFAAAASLGTGVMVKVEVAADPSKSNGGTCVMLSHTGTLTDGSCYNLAQVNSTYLTYTLNVTPTNLSSVKDYFKATFIKVGGSGTGGTVYFDNISYQQ